MTFMRTLNGLSNQHLFYKVDVIVYVEGGQGFSKNGASEGKFNRNSIDIKFWQGIFSIFYKDVKVEFRAIGSKSTLKNIVKEIEVGKIHNTYVAMDRDFDFLKNTNIRYKGAIFTYGYSWENDVWQKEIIEDVLNTICTCDSYNCKIEDIKNVILQVYSSFLGQIDASVCADAFLSIENKSFFNRKKPLGYLIFKKNTKPKVNLEKIKSEFQTHKFTETEAKEFGKENNIQVQRDCLGHIISGVCYQIIAFLLNKIGDQPSIPKCYINCIGIEKFIFKLSNRHFADIYNHYSRSFSFLKAGF